MRLVARLYVDPTCSHTWQAMPAMVRLRQDYGSVLDFDYVVYPLHDGSVSSGAAELGAGRYSDADMVSHMAEASEYLGRPIAHSVWSETPIRDTRLTALAVHAARQQSRERAQALFDRLQWGAMTHKEDIGQPTAVLHAAASAGLDVPRWERDLADNRRQEELDADLAAIRNLGVRSRPTLILQRPDTGANVWVVGPQPDALYTQAVRALLAGQVTGDVRFGGRILPFADITVTAREPLADGWRHRLGYQFPPATGVPAERSVDMRFCAARLPRDPGFLTAMAIAGAPVATVTGQDVAGQPVHLVGTAAAHLTLLRQQLAQAGTPAGLPDPTLLRWLAATIADAPALTLLKWIPGTGGAPAELADALGPDHALLTIAEPLPAAAAAGQSQRLEQDVARFVALPAAEREWYGPAIADSIAYRRRQIQRLIAAGQGYWNVCAAVMTPGSQERTLQAARAAIATYRSPAEPLPLRALPVHREECDHLKLHLATFTLCGEQQLHGADRWNTLLLSGEWRRLHD